MRGLASCESFEIENVDDSREGKDRNWCQIEEKEQLFYLKYEESFEN